MPCDVLNTVKTAIPAVARWAAGLIVVVCLIGCDSLGYYAHLTGGQWNLVRARQSVERILADSATDAELKQHLLIAQSVVAFAESDLGLSAHGSYRQYVHLDRSFVVWNVFAAEPWSLEGFEWCYPFVGCAPYRGFFSRSGATQAAAELAGDGYETYVGGVPAYSTLGWFDDPILSSFIDWPAPQLAELLIHEIAHQRVWVKGDTAFNESFASFVAQAGTRAWFQRRERMEEFDAYRASALEWRRLRDLLIAAKATLQVAYTNPNKHQRGVDKQRILEALRACYIDKRDRLGRGRYDAVLEHVNNAYFVSIGTYEDYQPGFEALFQEVDGDWSAFLDAVETLAELAESERHARLSHQQVAQGRDHDDADQVQCEAFLRHRLKAETSSTEHDDIGRGRHR